MRRRLAVVLGRNYVSRLGMIRAAGKSGCDVAVINTNRVSGKTEARIDASSRYVCGYNCCPQPDQAGLIALLKSKYADPNNKPVILPTDDYSAATIDEYQEELSKDFVLPGIAHRSGEVVKAMDKLLQKRIARETGLCVARGWKAEIKNGEYDIPDDVEFPCFVKPEISIRGSKYQMKKCGTRQELVDAVNRVREKSDANILIEEYIEIEKELAVLGVCLSGRCEMPAVLETELAYLGVTGIGKAVSITVYPGLWESLERFIRAFDFDGLFDIDLFVSKGKVYFNELNLRYGANGYAVSLGVRNLPGLFINGFTNETDSGQTLNNFTPFTFMNEKVCHQLCTDGIMKWCDFYENLNEVRVTLVRSADDPKPYRHFREKVLLSRIKHLIK